MKSARHLSIGWARTWQPTSYTIHCHRHGPVAALCHVVVRVPAAPGVFDGGTVRLAYYINNLVMSVRDGHSEIVKSFWKSDYSPGAVG